MAARNRPGLSENTRKRIQTTMLVKRLEQHILGKVELSQSQVRGIEVLLRKTLPDLSSVEHVGEVQTSLAELLSLAHDKRAETEKVSNNQEVKPNQAETRH